MGGTRASVISVIAASALVLGSVGTAVAKDLCVDLPGALGPVVGKNFTVPGVNKCKPFTGFVGTNLVSGTGCTSASGSFFRLAFTAYDAATPGGNPITAACSLPRPALTGGSCLLTVGVPGSTSDDLIELVSTASAEPCTVAVP